MIYTNIIIIVFVPHFMLPLLLLIDNSGEVKVIILSGPMTEDGGFDNEDQLLGLPPFFDKIFQSFLPSFSPPPVPTKTSVKVHYTKKHSKVPCDPKIEPTDCKSRSERVDETSELAEMMTNLQNVADKIFQNFFQSFFESEQENNIDVENATALGEVDDRVSGDSNGTELIFHSKHKIIDINNKTGNETGNQTNNSDKTGNGTGKSPNDSDKIGNGTGNSTLVEKHSQGKESNVSPSNAHDKDILGKNEKMPAKPQIQDNDAKGGIGLEALQANVMELLNSMPLQPEGDPHE